MLTPRVRGTAAASAVAVLGVVGAVGAAAAVWGIGIERYLYTVRRTELALLPPGSRPLRILHVSDLHMAPWQRRKQAWLESLTSLRPDLIVNTGDNLGHVEALDGVRRAFDGFRGIPGLYVHGSNDLHAPSPRNPFRYFLGPSGSRLAAPLLDTGAMDAYFRDELGWHELDNAVASLEVAGVRVDAFGVDDAHRDLDRIDRVEAPLAELREGSDSPADLTLGVTHAPYRRVLDAFVDFGADAIFAGHTHGGQVRVPGIGALVANCDIPLRQARGVSTWRHRARTAALSVSAGVGHSIYAPVRFACRPEVSLITLTARA